MRPDPDQRQAEQESGRIIYLGDVRRRRARGRPVTPDRTLLLALALIAAAAWIVWVAVLVGLPPHKLLTYLAFFGPLFVALAATTAIGIHLTAWRRGLIPRVAISVERGALTAFVAVANLVFLAAHRWTWPVGAITVGIVLALDAMLARRDR